MPEKWNNSKKSAQYPIELTEVGEKAQCYGTFLANYWVNIGSKKSSIYRCLCLPETAMLPSARRCRVCR
jgi:hypothetical protein